MYHNTFLENYRNQGFDLVHGWCLPTMFEVMGLLADCGINKEGGCLEIGVHHGKFYILLNSLVEPQFKSYALDIFDDQSLNIDDSGKGSLEKFRSSLDKFDRHKGENSIIIEGDSTDFGVIKILVQDNPKLRFISIDGGHTAEHTVSDLNLATRLISNEGVVILDDILNPHWLGVLSGATAFLNSTPTLVPFAVGQNKLLFSKISYYKYYFDLFSGSNLKTKEVDFLGHRLVAL
jgi:hypothetical protein